MTVYVDDFRVPARVRRVSGRWSHLFAGPWDDPEELHALARRIGLRREWFQSKGWPRDHYDVTDAKRNAAIRAGAVPVTWRETGRMIAAASDRGRSNPPTELVRQAADPATARKIPALTVHNPWALMLARKVKPVENRGWKLRYRGPLWLHAGKTWDDAGQHSPLVYAAWNELAGADDVLEPGCPLIPSGAVIALLEVTGGCHSDNCMNQQTGKLCSPWAAYGQYHIQVTVTAVLPSPVPCRGMQKLWTLPPDVETTARAQLRTVHA